MKKTALIIILNTYCSLFTILIGQTQDSLYNNIKKSIATRIKYEQYIQKMPNFSLSSKTPNKGEIYLFEYVNQQIEKKIYPIYIDSMASITYNYAKINSDTNTFNDIRELTKSFSQETMIRFSKKMNNFEKRHIKELEQFSLQCLFNLDTILYNTILDLDVIKTGRFQSKFTIIERDSTSQTERLGDKSTKYQIKWLTKSRFQLLNKTEIMEEKILSTRKNEYDSIIKNDKGEYFYHKYLVIKNEK